MSETFTGEQDKTEEEKKVISLLNQEGANINDVIGAIGEAYDAVVGDSGKDVWTTVTLPEALQVYGSTKPEKVGEFLLNVIDRAGSYRGEKAVASYLATAVPREELAFSQIDKKEDTKKIVEQIEAFIAKKASEAGESYSGVMGTLVFGSYARNEQRLGSDLDLAYVTKNAENGYLDKDGHWVDVEEFMDTLSKKLRPALSFAHFEIANLDDERTIKDLPHADDNKYIIVSPFPDVKEKLERLLKEEQNQV